MFTDLSEAFAFMAVARSESYTKASVLLGIPKSTLSRKVQSLEDRLQTKLIERTTRNLRLTEFGALYLNRMDALFETIKATEEELKSTSHTIAQKVKITAPVDFGTTALPPILEGFSKKYPETKFELLITDDVIDFFKNDIDIAIRAGSLNDSMLKQRKIGETAFQLFAHPQFQVNKFISHPSELSRLPLIEFSPDKFSEPWQLQNGKSKVKVKLDPKVRTNSLMQALGFCTCGMGVALLPRYLCHDALIAGSIERVLPTWESETDSLYMVYTNNPFTSRTLKELMNHLFEALSKTKW